MTDALLIGGFLAACWIINRIVMRLEVARWVRRREREGWR